MMRDAAELMLFSRDRHGNATQKGKFVESKTKITLSICLNLECADYHVILLRCILPATGAHDSNHTKKARKIVEVIEIIKGD